MKNSLRLLAVLALLSAGAFFAVGQATAAENNITYTNGLTSADGVSSAASDKAAKRKLAKLKKEAALAERKEKWKNLTPDQKKAAADKKFKAPELGTYDETKLSKAVREKIQKSTPEDAAKSKSEAIKTWTKLSADQKYFMKKNAKEKWSTLTTEEQDQFKAILAYDKAASAATTSAAQSTGSKKKVRAIGGTVMPDNYFEGIDAPGKSRNYKVHRDRNLNKEP